MKSKIFCINFIKLIFNLFRIEHVHSTMESDDKVTYEEYVELIDKFKKERCTLNFNDLMKFSSYYSQTIKDNGDDSSDYASILTEGYLSLEYEPSKLYLSFFEKEDAKNMLEHLLRTKSRSAVMGDEKKCIDTLKHIIFYINDFVFAIIMKHLAKAYDRDGVDGEKK